MAQAPILSERPPEWGDVFEVFHNRHRDSKKRPLKFTAYFNTALEALIDGPLCLEARCVAWAIRYSWGNNSDTVIDQPGGRPLGQKDFAERVKITKQRASEIFAEVEAHYYLATQGHLIYPIDDPQTIRRRNGEPKSGTSSDFASPYLRWCEEEWKVRYVADFQELESAEATVKRLRLVRLRLYRESEKARTNGGPILIEETLNYSTVSASSSFSADLSTEAPEEPTTTTDTPTEAQTAQTQDPRVSLKAESVEPVAEALACYGTPDAEAVQALIHGCREQAPDCTVEEIAVAIRQKGSQGVKMRNAIGFLIKSVPKVFFGRPTPQSLPPPTPSPPGVCPRCNGSGFVGRIWTTLPEARMLFHAGVPFCDCEAGKENEREMLAEVADDPR